MLILITDYVMKMSEEMRMKLLTRAAAVHAPKASKSVAFADAVRPYQK